MILTRQIRTFTGALCASVLLVSAARADELQLLWQQSPADGLPYLGTGNTDRGVAINPVTGNILVVSRTTVGNPGEVYVLNGETGEQISILSTGSDPSLISGGTFVQNLIGVADDGVIYVANLTTSTTNPQFRVYRWASETDPEPVLAYAGDPSGGDATAPRWGDSFGVRGAGTDTQWVAGAGGTATIGAVFTTTDGINFSATKISNITANSVSFGPGNTVWTKRTTQATRLIGFDLGTGVGTPILSVPTSIIPATVVPVGGNDSNYLAAINITAAGVDDARLYDVSITNDVVIVDQEVFPADNANANAAGSVDIEGEILAALDTNNGLMVFRIIKSVTAPEFTSQPASTTIIEGGSGSLIANVSGTRPLNFQWTHNGTNVTRGTNATLSFAPITLDDQGEYNLVAWNSAGTNTSDTVTLTVQALVQSQTATVLWRLAPGSRSYINGEGSNTERGVAYDTLNNRVLVVSRAAGINIHVLDADTGADLWTLQTPTDIIPTTASTPGGFRLNMVGVAEDGVVYAANLTTGAGEGDATAFRIYRWEDSSSNSVPVEVYRGAPVAGRRFGDTFDIRGSGSDTQILLGNNLSTAAEPDNTTVIMTTADSGLTWTPNIITTPGVDDEAFRLGIAFGSSNTFWGKVAGQSLREVSFDLTTGFGTLLHVYTNVPSSSSAISVSSNFVAVLALENPDNLRLYDLDSTGETLTLVDQELFATDFANANGTGSADFGKNRLYVLDTNNGLLALEVSGNGGPTSDPATFGSVSANANALSFTVSGTPNATYQLEATSDFQTWTNVQTLNIESDGSNDVTIANSGNYRFYRAVAE